MRDIPTSPRVIEIRHKRRAHLIRLIVLFSILFISIIIALSYFSEDRHVVIDKITVTGTHILNDKDVESQVFKDLSGKYIYLFSKSNTFIYPRKKIYKDLISEFPRIETISISRLGLKALHIDITERKGVFLYCGADVPSDKNQVGENCYFINNDGFIFDKAPYFSGNVYFKYYTALSGGVVNPLGTEMISADQFHRITRFIDTITTIGKFNPIYIVLGEDDSDHLYLEHGPNDTTPEIIFKNDDDFSVVQDNFSIAMKKIEFASEIKSKYNTLLYIDLRFKNKVLYKFQ
jgi:hypothetical protein